MYSELNVYIPLSSLINGLCLHYLPTNGDATHNHLVSAWPKRALVVCAVDIQCFCYGIESTEWMSAGEDM